MTEGAWNAEFSAIETLPVWNRNVIPWMKERGEAYKLFAAKEAKRRGYEADKEMGLYRMPWRMMALKGRNCIAAGWQMNWLRMAFAGKEGSRFYLYKDIEKDVFDKLIRSPFPDKLFVQLVKNKRKEFVSE